MGLHGTLGGYTSLLSEHSRSIGRLGAGLLEAISRTSTSGTVRGFVRCNCLSSRGFTFTCTRRLFSNGGCSTMEIQRRLCTGNVSPRVVRGIVRTGYISPISSVARVVGGSCLHGLERRGNESGIVTTLTEHKFSCSSVGSTLGGVLGRRWSVRHVSHFAQLPWGSNKQQGISRGAI